MAEDGAIVLFRDLAERLTCCAHPERRDLTAARAQVALQGDVEVLGRLSTPVTFTR